MDNAFVKITNYLWSQSWQLALLIVVVATISWALRNRSAHIRYLLWLIVLVKCLVPPFMTVPVAILPQDKSIKQFQPPPIAEPPIALEASDVGKSVPAMTPVTSIEKNTEQPKVNRLVVPSVHQLIGAVWILGIVIFACVAAARAARSSLRLRGQRRPLPSKLQTSVDELLSGFGTKACPRVWLLDGIGQPFVWGLFRGSIYLPADYLKIDTAAHRRNILGHELCHVLRLDAAVNLLQIVAQAVFWFHPFVWWANQKIRMEREKCCDEMVVAHLGTKVKEYSTAIVKALVTEHESSRPVPSLAVAGSVKDIEERIRTMLRPGKKFYKRPSLIAATAIVLIAMVTVPTALVLTARAETTVAAESKETSAESLQQIASQSTDRSEKLGQLLVEAVWNRDIDQARSLLSRGALVNARDKHGNTPLHIAAKHGNLALAQLMIAKGAYVDARDKYDFTPLHWAAEFGHEQIAQLLVAKEADVNATNRWNTKPAEMAWWMGHRELHDILMAAGTTRRPDIPDSELHIAAQNGQVDVAKRLIDEGAKVNARNTNGMTPLHIAVQHGHKRIVELLIAQGADIEAKNVWGGRPLKWAVVCWKKDMVELLIAKGADVNAGRGEGGETALYWAARDGLKEIAELLLANGAFTDAKESYYGNTTLHRAVERGHKDLVELLLEKGAAVDPLNGFDQTPLHIAAVRGAKEIANILIAHGADTSNIHIAAFIGDIDQVKRVVEGGVSPNTRDRQGNTLLKVAALGEQARICEYLLTHGAFTKIPDEDGYTPLHWAAAIGLRDVAELLIAKGDDINAKDEEGDTPLHAAARRGQMDVAEMLIAKGAEVNTKNNKGQTATHMAVFHDRYKLARMIIANGASVDIHSAAALGNIAKVKSLLESGIDADTRDGNRSVPLHEAAYCGRKEIVELLIAKGADVDARQRWGATPLYEAAEMGHKDVVELLLAKGADINVPDNDGRTPLWRAKDRGHNEIVELLRKHGAKE